MSRASKPMGLLAPKYGVNERIIRPVTCRGCDMSRESLCTNRSLFRWIRPTGDAASAWWSLRTLSVASLWYKFVRHETIADYMEGVEWLKSNGFKIYGTIIAGMKGLARALFPSPYNCASSTRCLPTWLRSLSRRPQENFWTLPTA